GVRLRFTHSVVKRAILFANIKAEPRRGLARSVRLALRRLAEGGRHHDLDSARFISDFQSFARGVTLPRVGCGDWVSPF
ncbi:MAG: hypothetical protein WD941_04815, partial [Opitutus sp.]